MPIGTKLSCKRHICMICGTSNPCEGVVWTYLGEESPTIHIVNPDTPLSCSGCDCKATKGRVVCGSGNAFTVIAYPIPEFQNQEKNRN